MRNKVKIISDLVIPSTFKMSSRCPTLNELKWIYNWLKENINGKNKKVLEFGCGITSWVLYTAIKSIEIQVAVEKFKPCIEVTKKHIPLINIVDSWDKIPKNKYDIVLIDGSTGRPKNFKCQGRLKRHGVIRYIDVENLIHENSYIILHDWHHKYQYRLPIKYLEENGFKLIASYQNKYGVGIYKR